MINPIKFGTDGWRAVIARDFTFDNVRICAQALADYMKQANLAEKGLIIGYDTRFASEDFAAACAEVSAANGIKTLLCTGATPTPVISWGVLAKRMGAAIDITASHNPHTWNGFKIKTFEGTSAPTGVIDLVEKNIQDYFSGKTVKQMSLKQAEQNGLLQYVDLAPVYRTQIENLIDVNRLKQAKLKIIVDSMYGAGSGYLDSLLSGGNLNLIEINGERNPLFPGIHPEPIAVNLAKLMDTVKTEKASVGFATDGDADRMGIVAEDGEFLTQLQVFALLCLYFLETRCQRGPLVKTITTSSMIDKLGKLFNVPVYETAVGFKYVAPIMMEKDAIIGGEESGGYGFRGHAPERDGILAILYFLDFMVSTGKSPKQLLNYLYEKVGPHYYHRVDIIFPAEEREQIINRVRGNWPQSLDGERVQVDTKDGFRFTTESGRWLLIRFSGTEPLLRIYAECESMKSVNKFLQTGKELVGF